MVVVAFSMFIDQSTNQCKEMIHSVNFQLIALLAYLSLAHAGTQGNQINVQINCLQQVALRTVGFLYLFLKLKNYFILHCFRQ